MESKKKVVFEWGQAEAKMRLLNDGTVEFSMPPITDGWHYWRKDTSSEELARMKMQYEPPGPEVIFEQPESETDYGMRVHSDGTFKWIFLGRERENSATCYFTPLVTELARLWRIVHERE